MAETIRYVQITLAIEEVGVLDSGATDNRYTTRMYSLSDPGGTLDGELELVCTQDELERELKLLGAVNITPVSPKPSITSGYKSSPTVSSGHSKIVAPTSLKEVPSHISASSLVSSLARETGSTSVFTSLLGDLIDDLLRPQSSKRK